MSTSPIGGMGGIGGNGNSNGNGGSSSSSKNNNQDAPPISVVTTSSSSSSSHRREQQKMNTPTILLKPPSTSTTTTTSSSNHHYNGGGLSSNANPFIMMNSSNHYNNNTTSTMNSTTINNRLANFTTEKDDKDIDSALLSALRDKRERMGLLRLESKLVDFMNDKNCFCMDVGGPLNTTVIKVSNSGSSTSNTALNESSSFDSPVNSGYDDNSNTATATTMMHHSQMMQQPIGGVGGAGGVGGMMMIGGGNTTTGPISSTGLNTTMNGYNNVDQGGGREGRQTSFQRLILHRLADRFNIVRQNNINNNNNNNMHSNQGYYNLIRLFKVKESRIPTVKLIDLEIANYESPNNNNNNNVPQDRVVDSFDVVRGITDRFNAATQLDVNGCTNVVIGGSSAGGGGTGGKKSKKKEKVKIMKRMPNSNNTGNSNKNTDSGKNKRRGKKLSDREKAYAEARARIFNTQESSTGSNLDGSEHANSVTNESGTDVIVANPSPVSVETKTTSSDNNNINKKLLDRSTQASPGSSGDTQQQTTTTNHSSNDDSNDDVNVPAAAKGGAESKVLWRNRQQEACDPDFQRAHHPVMMQQPMYHQPHYDQNAMYVGGQVGYGAAGAGAAGGYYQPTMDPMAYNRNGQHAYYQPNDVSWQQQDPNMMHQMHFNYAYGSQQYDDGVANSECKDGKKQEAPVYTEEEFPALG